MLTPEQEMAAGAIHESVGIVANAGSGKTRVLIERVLRILKNSPSKLHNILLVTFTEKAALEIKARLAKHLPPELIPSLHTAPISTFHGFATRVVREHAPLLKLPDAFRILTEGEASVLLYKAASHALLGHLQDPEVRLLVERFRYSGILRQTIPLVEDRFSFMRWAQTYAEEDPLKQAVISLTQKIISHYSELKSQEGALDFHDLEIQLWTLLQNDPRILSDYQRQFHHLMVDEFQDTNPIQSEIVQLLFTPPDNQLCIVGDPKQSIYRFRGADVGCFAQILDLIQKSDGQMITLSQNFRSRPEITHFVNQVCREMPDYIPLQAQRSSDGTALLPLWITGKNSADTRRNEEALAFVAQLPELIARFSHSEIACLFPTRLGLAAWERVLKAAHVPIHVYNAGGLLETQEVTHLSHGLHVVAGLLRGKPDERHLLAFLLSPMIGESADAIYRKRHLTPESPAAFPHLPPLHQATLTGAFGEWMRKLCEDAPYYRPHELIRRMVQETGYLQYAQDSDPSGQSAANIESFIRYAATLTRTASVTIPQFLDELRELRKMGERVNDPPATLSGDNRIALMTIHAAKGNEFPVVVLADLCAKPNAQYPRWLFDPQLGLQLRYSSDLDQTDNPEWVEAKASVVEAEQQERDRLLYVAMTRARECLVLPLHTDFSGSQWHDRIVKEIK